MTQAIPLECYTAWNPVRIASCTIALLVFTAQLGAEELTRVGSSHSDDIDARIDLVKEGANLSGFHVVFENTSDTSTQSLKFSEFSPPLNVTMILGSTHVSNADETSSGKWHGAASYVSLQPKQRFHAFLPLSAFYLPNDLSGKNIYVSIRPSCLTCIGQFNGSELAPAFGIFPSVKTTVEITPEDIRLSDIATPSSTKTIHQSGTDTGTDRVRAKKVMEIEFTLFLHRVKGAVTWFILRSTNTRSKAIVLTHEKPPSLTFDIAGSKTLQMNARQPRDTQSVSKVATVIGGAQTCEFFIPMAAYDLRNLPADQSARLTNLVFAFGIAAAAAPQGGKPETVAVSFVIAPSALVPLAPPPFVADDAGSLLPVKRNF